MATYSHKAGRPCNIDQEMISKLRQATADVLVPNQIFPRLGLNESTFYLWMKSGKNDLENGVESPMADFYYNYLIVRSNTVKELLSKLISGSKNPNALIWILERCFRDDFGTDNLEFKEIKSMFEAFMKGVGANGQAHPSETEKNS